MYQNPRLLSPRESLHRQGYNFIADDATGAVKPCLWCKRALRGGDSCYKHQFYGIETWRCVQMTPTLRCNQRCLLCWRSMEYEPQDERILTPDEIIAAIPSLQRKGLSGDKTFTDEERWYTAVDSPTQYAISLSGEPTLYPRLDELIEKLQASGSSVFVVSNGTIPGIIAKIRPTQLYLSLNACTPEGYAELCRPVGDPELMWDNIQQSLHMFAEKETQGSRTAVRITLVKGYNDIAPEGFGAIIKENRPLFVEIKGYMYLGFSRDRLPETAVPEMDEIRDFARKVVESCGYTFFDEKAQSRVICLKRE